MVTIEKKLQLVDKHFTEKEYTIITENSTGNIQVLILSPDDIKELRKSLNELIL